MMSLVSLADLNTPSPPKKTAQLLYWCVHLKVSWYDIFRKSASRKYNPLELVIKGQQESCVIIVIKCYSTLYLNGRRFKLQEVLTNRSAPTPSRSTEQIIVYCTARSLCACNIIIAARWKEARSPNSPSLSLHTRTLCTRKPGTLKDKLTAAYTATQTYSFNEQKAGACLKSQQAQQYAHKRKREGGKKKN